MQPSSTACLKVPQKKFYFDVSTNEKGPYLKISEVRNVGERQFRWLIVVGKDSIPWFDCLLSHFIQVYSAYGTESLKELRVLDKVYFMEVEEYSGRRQLRISESGGPHGRSSLMVPALDNVCSGWQQFREVLLQSGAMMGASEDVSEDRGDVKPALVAAAEEEDTSSGQGSGGSNSTVPIEAVQGEAVLGPGVGEPKLSYPNDASALLNVGNKRIYFDEDSNHYGRFLRVSEMLGKDKLSRKTVVVPAVSLQLFRQAIEYFEHREQAALG